MQSEDFDKRIREAADNHHPAYDEKAWGKMETLLDKHLPQEKEDRRRIIFFLLLFLLVGSGVWLGIAKPWKQHSAIAKVQEHDPKSAVPSLSTGSDNKNTNATPVEIEETTNNNTSNTFASENNKPVTIIQANNSNTSSDIFSNQKNTKPILVVKKQNNKPAINIIDKENKINNQTIASFSDPVEKTENGKVNKAATGIVANQTNDKIADPTDKTIAATAKDNKDPIKNDTAKNEETAITKPAIKKEKNKKNNSFFFSFSAGPDISAAGTDKPGKMKLLAGAGLGYTFNNRLTIRTGFYTGRKIYSASAASYHPPADFSTYYPYLQKVEADCKIFEIPLSVSYRFGKSTKQNWFVSTGLSSYLMKKEVYNYYYKQTVAGQTMSRKWTIEDENKHYFSVLTLSGGYQKTISKNITLTVEPYLKVPLKGVGYGNVKLNSGGVLFSVGINPFSSNKKSK